MNDLFAHLYNYVRRDAICINNTVFQLHCKLSVCVIMLFFAIVTARLYVGDPIDCISENISSELMDTYCWTYSTFTYRIPLNKTVPKNTIPGMGNNELGEGEEKYNNYYQWVCFALFFQGILFYVPHFIWKNWENGLIKGLVCGLDNPFISKKVKVECIKQLVKCFRQNLGLHNSYANMFFFCEVLNFVNVAFQLNFLNWFLDGEFHSYGWDVLSLFQSKSFYQQDFQSPMTKIFPILTKCSFLKYGPTGSIDKYNCMCILSINIVNEKIYLFLWFWFNLLLIITGISLIYRGLVVYNKSVQVCIIHINTLNCSYNLIKRITNKVLIGDWFIIYQLSKNINPSIFSQFITELANALEYDV